jgi:hypothetical protein
MPTKPKPEETKKQEESPKQKEGYHNFLVVDHSLRPEGFHLCSDGSHPVTQETNK